MAASTEAGAEGQQGVSSQSREGVVLGNGSTAAGALLHLEEGESNGLERGVASNGAAQQQDPFSLVEENRQ